MKKRNRQQNKALTNNQTPTENLLNEEVASELVDSKHVQRKKSKRK